MNTIAVDFETYFEKKTYSVTDLGTWRYCHDERFDPYMISVSDGQQSWSGEPKDFNWSSLEGATLLSHNAAFDQTVYRTMVEKGLAPEVRHGDWLCTANLTSFLCNRRALAQASEFLLGATMSKQARNDANGKHWRDIVAAGNGESMMDYARQDALTCHQIYSKYGHFWPEFERRLSDLTIRQSLRGVAIDTEKLNNYYKIVHEALARMQESLPWVARGEKVFSARAAADEARRCGIPGPPIKAHENGEENFAIWYKTYSQKFVWVRTFSDIRSIGILLDLLEKIRIRVDENGILTFGQKYAAAHTLRWGGDAGINLQTLRKAPYFFGDDGLPRAEESECEAIEQSFSETGKFPDWVRHVVDIRSLIIPRPGRKMITSDLSQIEPRCLASLCGDTELMSRVASGKSIYQSHAELTMDWEEGKNLKEHKKMYALAKARVIGLGYQCGAEKFISMAMTLAGLDITEGDPEFIQETERFKDTPIFNADGTPKMVSGRGTISKQTVKAFRSSNPKIVALWSRLDAAFKASVGGDFVMELPSGRKMTYRNVKEEWSRELDEETGKWRNRRVVKAEVVKSGRLLRAALYGGILTENLTQSVAREVFATHLLALDSTSGIDTLWGSHDEAICEVDQGVSARDVEEIMSVTPPWLAGCPIAAEAKEVPAYCK